jgi:tetratricopeptide (TPR) repeat protein
MDSFIPKSPWPVSEPVGQADAAISAQLTSVKSEGRFGLSGSVYSKIVQVLLYAAVLLVPLLYLPWTSSVLEYSKQLVLVVVAAVGLVVWLLGVVVSGKLTIRTTPVDKGVYAILVAAIVSAIFSLTPAKSIFGISVSLSSSLLTVIVLSIFYFLAVNTLHDRGRMLRQVLGLSFLIALVVGLCQMFTWYFLPGSFTGSRAFNTVGSLNALGMIAAIALPMFAKSTIRAGKWVTGLAVAGIILAILVLAILNWWVLWAVALAGMLAMIAFDSLNVTQLAEDYGKKRFALSRFVVPMVVIVLGAFLLLVKFSPGSLKGQFPVEVAPSYSMSVGIVKDVLKEKLLFGWGLENFSLAFDKFGASDLANTQLSGLRFFDGTSEIFNIAVHGGALMLLAVLLLVWCLVQVVARFGGAISDSIARGENHAWAVQSSGSLAALIAITVALFMYPFNIVLWFAFYAFLVLAALIVSGDKSRTVDIEERPMYSLSASLGFIVGLILVLSGVYFFSVRYMADARYASAARATTPETAMDGIVRAIDLDGSSDRYYRDASQVALAMLRAEVAKGAEGDAQKVQNLISSSIQLAQRAAQVAPLESLNWANLGEVYQSMTGVVDNVERLAEDAFKKAGELRPGDPSFDNRIGQMWIARADLLRSLAKGANAAQLRTEASDSLVRAEEAFKRAIEKSPTFGLAIYNLGAVYDRQDKVDDAIAQLERIAPYNANQPTLMFELGLLYVRAGKKDNALAAMRRAVLLAPQFANARWYLALLLEDAGDIDGAIAQLEEIQKDNADNDVLTSKIEQLKAGNAPEAEDVIDNEPIE